MTISIWRYSHLSLALVSGLFLVLASITGIILALEPIQNAVQPYDSEELSEITISQTLDALQDEYDEVLSIEVDANQFMLAQVVTKEGDNTTVFIHPKTGELLGEPQPQHPIFQFTTNLHRSLFLKGVGRFFVGLVSFLLCLLAITGLLLLIKRQGGLLKLFSKFKKEYFELRYHVVLGRWFLIPIIIVAATGVYLSLEKFSLLPTTQVVHELPEPETEVDLSVSASSLPIFQEIHWDEVRELTFPFSEFPEDYFELALKDKEVYIHQYTGEILSEQTYPFTFLASQWSFKLHTGQGSIVWSLILLFASGSLLFFIYSGVVMWQRRLKNSKRSLIAFDKDECSHIILVGSETGTTYAFAEALQKGLIQAGKKAFVGEINTYTTYDKAEQFLFLTATYGEGEAPTNARNIEKYLAEVQQPQPVQYAVVGFGSLAYPGYCQFAVDLDQHLQSTPGFSSVLPLHKINNQSFEAFTDWAQKWGTATGVTLRVKAPEQEYATVQQHPFTVAHRTEINEDDTYVLQLLPPKKVQFQSGDLWKFTPEEDRIPRSYSIAKYKDQLLLSIKKHEFGLCSSLLSTLAQEATVEGALHQNSHFHFPKNAHEVICIANGTGIAPFLGMIHENEKKVPLQLYWGGRTKASMNVYADYISEGLEQKRLHHFHLALSREGDTRQYVQDLLERDSETLARQLKEGAVLMICGSVAMQRAVLEVLEGITQNYLRHPLSVFEQQKQLKMDCY